MLGAFVCPNALQRFVFSQCIEAPILRFNKTFVVKASFSAAGVNIYLAMWAMTVFNGITLMF